MSPATLATAPPQPQQQHHRSSHRGGAQGQQSPLWVNTSLLRNDEGGTSIVYTLALFALAAMERCGQAAVTNTSQIKQFWLFTGTTELNTLY